MGGPWESPPRPTGFLHEPTLLPGSSSPATGQNPSPKGREPPLTSDARHRPGTGGELLCQPTRSHTQALQLVRWKVNILEILFACPGVTLGEDTVPGWAPAIHPAGRPTPPLDKASATAADVWLNGLQHHLTLAVAACLGQTQESDPEEQRLGASGTGQAGSWCPQGRIPGERCPGRGRHLPGTSWPWGQQTGKPARPRGGAEECCLRPGGKISTWEERKQLGLCRGEKARRGWGRAETQRVAMYLPLGDQFSSVQPLSPVQLRDPMNRSTPGLPVHHQLPELTQTHVHRVSDAIQPSHPLSSPSPPAPNPSQHQSLFQ